MSQEDTLKRQLRFALFLQIAGAAMFGVAFAVRASSLGMDLITAVFGLVAILIIVAAVFTARRMRGLSR